MMAARVEGLVNTSMAEVRGEQGHQVMRWRRPAQITKEEFLKNVEERMRLIKAADLRG
jgi:hypothetical protein